MPIAALMAARLLMATVDQALEAHIRCWGSNCNYGWPSDGADALGSWLGQLGELAIVALAWSVRDGLATFKLLRRFRLEATQGGTA